MWEKSVKKITAKRLAVAVGMLIFVEMILVATVSATLLGNSSKVGAMSIRQITTSSADDMAPIWSPDSQKIAFASYNGTTMDICIINVDETGLTKLVTGIPPSLSRNYNLNDWLGLTILYLTPHGPDSHVYKINSDGTNLTKLDATYRTFCSGARFSPDGTKIGFLSDKSNMNGWPYPYIINTDGSGENMVGGTHTCTLTWLSDSSKLVYATGSDYYREQTIYTVNQNGSNIKAIVSGLPQNVEFSSSPDGEKIVYLSGVPTNTRHAPTANRDISIMNSDGSGKIDIVTDTSDEYFGGVGYNIYCNFRDKGVWSPDGTKIVFSSNRNGNGDVYMINADGTGLTQLTNNTAHDYDATWSPDGTKIAFVSERSGNKDIWVITAKSNEIPDRTAEWTFETDIVTDDSGNGHTWNYNYGTDYPQQDSAEKRFGSYSAFFDGYESGWTNQNAPWGTAHFLYQNCVVGSGDVTFDAWFKIENLSKWQYIYSERGVSYGWHVNYEPYEGKEEGRLRFNSRDYVVYTDINISNHDWHWVAVRRSGGQCSIWLDGKKSSDVKSCMGASGQSRLGARRCNHAVFQGWMDNVKLWNQGLSDDVIENQLYVPLEKEPTFDTEPSENPYPSIMGTHKGEIRLSDNINVSKLYTYPCVGTGGHTKSIELEENGIPLATGTWNGYQGDWHNITIHNVSGAPYVMLYKGHKYNYTIVTGSYPQIIHEPSKEVTGGNITCSSFVDANGKVYYDWTPAIRLE